MKDMKIFNRIFFDHVGIKNYLARITLNFAGDELSLLKIFFRKKYFFIKNC